MALNVQLVFFHGYTSVQLRQLEKWYLFGAYGVPAITAIAYICIDHLTNTKVIGPGSVSTMWLPFYFKADEFLSFTAGFLQI